MKTHAGYIILIAIAALGLWLGFTAWRVEHDRALLAEQQIKVSEVQFKALQDQVAERAKDTAATVAALRAQAKKVETPQQAIAAIPQVTDIPLNMRPSVDNPGQVSVDVVPLFRGLEQCREDAVQLNSCQLDKKDLQAQVDAKAAEVKALKAKPKFWDRVKTYGKVALGFTSIGLAIGAAVAK